MFPLPAVGDSVLVGLHDPRRAYSVLTRHFSYSEVPELGLFITVNIVVTDLPMGEYAARNKD